MARCTIARRNPDGSFAVSWDDGTSSPDVAINVLLEIFENFK